MQDFQLDIVTPYGEIFNGKVTSVYFPGKDGEFGVLSGHCDMLALLQAGVIDIHGEKTHDLVAINWGHVSISHNKVSVLADGAVCVRGDGKGQVGKALEEAKALLEAASSDTAIIAGALRKIDEL
ncbi:F0F1 ATP synthase subunit epsilon [Helicobacter saguini]|uniref:ATP synthase epsilon chain n=1 Tax=Helicobacter saguini TaxID=1548018 RepID=A0A347VSC0_9HELI|nr:ATP synthase F1 subunit epsilon [Helicobacter saguini]MWV62568.1 F0F1 ATP synthase subunit epsilon [Helicobacter saguini]MWV66758.1 F0F1 ATP synthase subunit epsilon [Helicobacter saguini]MWV69109.1 F0F1 ATP synthase subunit epsilon [Helicobacter saguini]MWV71336.1 F0F1 ATP synthase subunit epsilon [Helicobacter saguini]TLD94156.1 F0F1 ATP synthase subunit epsilon [Helicobacter saguini]